SGGCYLNLAFVFENLGKIAEAEALARRACKAFERSRLQTASRGIDRAGFTSEHSPYETLVALLLRQGKAEEAWTAFESILGRGLLDDVSARSVRALTNADRAREDALLGQIRHLEERVNILGSGGQSRGGSEASIEGIRSERDRLRAELAEFE